MTFRRGKVLVMNAPGGLTSVLLFVSGLFYFRRMERRFADMV